MEKMKRLESRRELLDYLEDQGRRLEKVYARIAQIASDMEICTSQRVSLKQLVREAKAGLDFEVPDEEIEIRSEGWMQIGGWSVTAQIREDYEGYKGIKGRAVFPRGMQLRISLQQDKMTLIRARDKELPQTLEELANYRRKCDNQEYSAVLMPLYRIAAEKLAVPQAT